MACFAVCWHESFVSEEGRIGACGAQLCFGGWKNDALGARAKKSKEEMFYHVFQGSQALTQGSAGMFDMLSCACAGHDVPRTLKHGTCACVWHDESLPLLVAGSRSGSNHGPGTLAWLDLICLGWSGQETSKIADLCRPFGNLATEGVEGIRPLSLLPKPSGETPAAGIRLLSLLPKPSGETPAAGIRPLSLLPKPSGETPEGMRPFSLLPKPSGETPAAGIRPLSLLPKPSGETPAGIRPFSLLPKPFGERPAGIRPLSLLPKPFGERPAGIRPLSLLPKPSRERPAGIRPLSLLPKPSRERPAGIRPLSLLPKPSRERPAGIRPLSLLPKPSGERPAGIRPLSLLPKPSGKRTAGIRPLSLLPKPSGERPAGIRPLKLATARPGTCSFPVKFIGVVVESAMVFLILIFSALAGVVVSGLWKLLKKLFQRDSKRTPKMRRIKPRQGGCWIRIRTRKCFKRVCVERILLVGRKSPKAPTKGKPKTLKLLACLRRVWHVLACCLDVACLVLKGNDERVPEGGLKQPVTGHLRMLRGLPLPGSGTGSDPLILDRDDGEPPSSSNQPNRSPQNPEQPPEAPIPQGEEIEERIPLRSHALQVHRSRGHFPYDVNCESCCSSKGKVPARRLKRQLQKENQTIGVDFYYFGKLRVLLLVHVASRYSMSIPAMELHDPNLLFNIDRFIREIGLHQKTLTFRCDNEQGLISMCERVAAQRRENPTIVDVVPGYRPQSKGAVERQVSAMKQGFWSIWLDLEAEIKRRRPAEEGGAAWQLPLGGMLWQTCLLYAARSFNLWNFDSNNSTTAIDRLHEEIVQRTRTLPFGCSAQAKVGGSKRHLEKFRGAKTVRVSYLGPVHPRGGGVYGTVIGGDGEIEVFPACRGIFERDEPTYDSPTLELLAKANPLVLDTQDPEKPLLFEPPAEPIVPKEEEIEAPEDEEMLPDYVPDYEPTEVGSEGHEGVAGGDLPEPDMEDMEIDWLTDHYLQKLGEGPDCRAVSNQAASSFELKFGGSRICCQVPQQAVSETSGELLDPKLLYLSMKLELEELESFNVGEVVSEREAYRLAKESGRRVLSSRWVNTVKKPGLYRSRLVVRDFAAMGGTTLAEGIYSPTTSLEGLRLLLSVLCRKGSVLSCDVSVAFMHAAIARPEFVQLPSNIGNAKTGERVFLKLFRAMNGLRSAPLSWYKELSAYLGNQGFQQILDPTIFRKKTKNGLVIVLFYVDDLLIWAENTAEARKVYEDLKKRYKLKLTGELLEGKPGEVSFLGRRIFRKKPGEPCVYFGLDAKYLRSCCEEYGITKVAPKLPPLERRYADLIKKGQDTPLTPEAHERYRRTLGRLAWASLSRPDLQYVCGFLGRHQSAPNEAAEACMRDVLRWVSGLPHKVQVFPSRRELLAPDEDRESVSCFVDASWGLNSVSGGIVTWNNCCLKTFSRKQTTVALSSAEAELAALTEIALAREGLYISLLVQTMVEGMPSDSEEGRYQLHAYGDSESALSIAQMSTLLRKVRHIELRAAFLQQLVAKERLTLEYIPGKLNPADALTKSPTAENVVSLCEAAGLINEPESWSSISEENVEEVRNEPNITKEVSSNAVRSSPLEVPSSWMEAATAVAKGTVSLVVLELCCEESSAIARACAREKGIAYFGVTREINLLSKNTFLVLEEILRVLKQGKVRVFAHLSTLCSSGCPLRYLRFRKRRGLELWRKTLKIHKSCWRLIGKLFGPYASNEGLLLTHEWPERSSLWKETVFLEVSKSIGLTQGCLVDRCCFEKKEKTWKRWWFASNSAACVWELSSYVCAGNHEHSKSASLKESGTYPEELGKALVRIGKKILKQEERKD